MNFFPRVDQQHIEDVFPTDQHIDDVFPIDQYFDEFIPIQKPRAPF